MFRKMMFAALVVAFSVNVVVAQAPPSYEKGLKELAAQAATLESTLSSAETEAAQAATIVKSAKVKVTEADALLAGLKKAQADLQAAEGNIAPKQQAEVTAEARLQAAQTADETKAAALDYAKALSEYESAKNAPIGLRAIYAKEYSLECNNVDAGLATKVTETEKNLDILRKQLVLDEEVAAAKTDAVSALKAEAEKVRRNLGDARQEAMLTELQAVRIGSQVIASNTAETTTAVKEVKVSVGKVEVAVDGVAKKLDSLHDINCKMLTALSAVQVADEAVQKDIDVVRTTIDGLMRKFPNDPAVQQKINKELKQTIETLPTPAPVSRVVTPTSTPVAYSTPQQCRTGNCPQANTGRRVYLPDGAWYTE